MNLTFTKLLSFLSTKGNQMKEINFSPQINLKYLLVLLMSMSLALVSAQEICGNSIDDDNNGFVDEGCSGVNYTIHQLDHLGSPQPHGSAGVQEGNNDFIYSGFGVNVKAFDSVVVFEGVAIDDSGNHFVTTYDASTDNTMIWTINPTYVTSTMVLLNTLSGDYANSFNTSDVNLGGGDIACGGGNFI